SEERHTAAATHRGHPPHPAHLLHQLHHAAAPHLLHHALQPLDSATPAPDPLNLHAASPADAPLAPGHDQLALAPVARLLGEDDPFLPADVALGAGHVGFGRLGGHLLWQLVHQAGEAAHLLHLLQLAEEVVEVEAGAALDLGGELLGCGDVDARRDLLDQRDDV